MAGREPFLSDRLAAACRILDREGFSHYYPPYPVPGGHLGFSLMGFGVTDLRALSLVADELNGLALDTCPVTDDDLAPIAGFPVLRRLDLSGTRVTDAVVDVLATLPELDALVLAGTRVTDGAMVAVSGLPKLTALDLTDTRVGDAGMAALAESRSLRWLVLRRTRVTVRGVAGLAACPALERVGVGDGWRMRRRVQRALPGVALE